MHQSDSFGDTKFLDELMSSNQATEPHSMSPTEGAATRNSTDGTAGPADDIELDEVVAEIAAQFRLRDILEEVCAATGATGAAIALARGNEMVCRATAGSDAPDLGVCLDPTHGLSGSCIRTRELQQCADTETDPRVDSVACRQLGVRSIAVLPLVEENQLLGIFEILSSRPNAFGPEELLNLQTFSERILQHNSRETKGTLRPAKSSRSSIYSGFDSQKTGARHVVRPAESNPAIPRRKKVAKRGDIWTPIIGSLVIGVAMLLGGLIGWRIGWERATLQMRNGTLPQALKTPSRTVPPDAMLHPAIPLQPNSASMPSDHGAGPASTGTSGAPGNLTRPRDHGFSIHQGDKSILAESPAVSTRTRNSQASQP